MSDLTCSKKEACANYPHRCKDCGMTSDIINHHPMYQEKDINVVNKFVEKIVVEHSEKVDGLLFGEIQRMATDEGFETKITLYKSTIMDALRKQIPQKPLDIPLEAWLYCPSCGGKLDDREKKDYCADCGQKIDWSDAE